MGKKTITGISAAAIIAASFAVPFEGTKYVSYKDVGGRWTICNGHSGPDVHEGQTATPKQCHAFLISDMQIADAAYDRMVIPDYNPNVKAACMDFIYNAGSGAFYGSSMRKYLNSGNQKLACSQFHKWKYAAGQDCTIKDNGCYGIINRRLAEQDLCNDPNYYISFTIGPDNILHGIRPAPPVSR